MEMAGRIKTVRANLYDELVTQNGDKDWSFVTRQIGMFSFTGLNERQVTNMTEKHAIYMTKDGRISLAGLSQGTYWGFPKSKDCLPLQDGHFSLFFDVIIRGAAARN